MPAAEGEDAARLACGSSDDDEPAAGRCSRRRIALATQTADEVVHDLAVCAAEELSLIHI